MDVHEFYFKLNNTKLDREACSYLYSLLLTDIYKIDNIKSYLDMLAFCKKKYPHIFSTIKERLSKFKNCSDFIDLQELHETVLNCLCDDILKDLPDQVNPWSLHKILYFNETYRELFNLKNSDEILISVQIGPNTFPHFVNIYVGCGLLVGCCFSGINFSISIARFVKNNLSVIDCFNKEYIKNKQCIYENNVVKYEKQVPIYKVDVLGTKFYFDNLNFVQGFNAIMIWANLHINNYFKDFVQITENGEIPLDIN